jgi:hypothetical protein
VRRRRRPDRVGGHSVGSSVSVFASPLACASASRRRSRSREKEGPGRAVVEKRWCRREMSSSSVGAGGPRNQKKINTAKRSRNVLGGEREEGRGGVKGTEAPKKTMTKEEEAEIRFDRCEAASLRLRCRRW